MAAAFLLLSLTGCGMGYYMHLAYGQMRLVFGAVPLEEALQDGPLSAEERERLKMVGLVKRFGQEELGLKGTDSYESVYLKSRQNPMYTVSASQKDRLARVTWWFPFVGAMPYIGFFDRESADRKKAELVEQDLDVIVSKASAYSTLGWFDDPVTLNLLDAGPVELAEIILHEMTHTTIYVKGQGEFNEGFAMLVGLIGAERFFRELYGPEHPWAVEAKRAIEEERRFSLFLDALLLRLEDLYNSPLSTGEKLSRREAVFSEAAADFREMKQKLQMRRFARFGSSEINNAYLMALALYHRRFPLFEEFLLSEGSVEKMLASLRALASEEGEMMDKMRSRPRSP
jgi:predicted aminopeptidase